MLIELVTEWLAEQDIPHDKAEKVVWIGPGYWAYIHTPQSVNQYFPGVPGRSIVLDGPGYFFIFDSANPRFFEDLKNAIDETIQHTEHLQAALDPIGRNPEWLH